MPMFVKDATVWKTTNPKVRDGGVWKQVSTGSVRDGGVWKVFFNNITFTTSVSSLSVNESATVTFYVVPSTTPSNTISYFIRPAYGSAWDTLDYSVNSSTGQEPNGPDVPFDGTQWALGVVTNSNDAAEGTEYFYVDFYYGYGVYTGDPIATSSVVAVNEPSCIWALYGRPEWC